MSQVRTQAAGYSFDEFYIDALNRRLWRNGELLALNSKYFDVLLLLVSQSGKLVEKQRIFDEIWEGVFVTDAALTQCIKDIRRQLGDDASNPRYIRTVPKHGYTFIADTIESTEDIALTAHVSAVSTQPKTMPRPYKFLDYYTEQDAQLFFGREQEVETISSQILARRSFILHGRSGVGKSSILRAGLMPRLKSAGHQVFVIRSFTDPLHQMAAALSSPLPQDLSDKEAIIRRLKEAPPLTFTIFFLDQFEEFFLLLTEETRRRFIDAMARMMEGAGPSIADEALPLRLVFTLREDLLAEMSQIKPAIPEIFHHEYRLKRLGRHQAAIAIKGPAEASGCRYEPQLVERLLDDLTDGEGIDPPQMQIVCDNLYDARDEQGNLTLDAYERLGTASQILAGYLDRVLRRFNRADLETAKEILSALISVDGQRIILRATEIEARTRNRAGKDASRITRLVEEMVAARVVRRRSQDGEAWLELAHDFLTPEVSRWLTDEARSLKRARAVIGRAMENYRSHGLTVDGDALDLLLPFGEQLGLTGEEADLLMLSVLTRARNAPAWLVCAAPGSAKLIVESARASEPEVRLCAIEACLLLLDDGMKDLLRKMALWDEDLGVRKAAAIALGDRFQEEAAVLLSESERADEKEAGLIRKISLYLRRAISLAMLRDHDRRLAPLSALSIPVALLVVMGLAWVRLRRDGHEILRRGIGGTLGAMASGVLGGLMLGAGLAMARHATAFEAASLILVLVSMGTFIGAIGGLGVSFAMIAAAQVTYRHSRWWSVVGGAAGGAIVGGSSNLLGTDALRALFGQNPTGLTGALEGAVIGAGVSLGAVLVMQLTGGARPWQKILGASLGAMCAGIALTVIGGNLFSSSLEIVARSFADSQMRMDPLAPYFGEVRFGQTTQIIMGAIEGLLFGAGMTAGIEMSNRGRNEESGSTGK
ncbi:MAG: winged helix-turn-helix domain-containing protein [Blastocatellia bacterium]|nr:winged helix-turn-helix domain-containing protein [Blastocatellia bacterium]